MTLTGENVKLDFETGSLRVLWFLPATLVRAPDGVVQVEVAVPGPGVYQVQASTDLANWQALANFTVTQARFSFTDGQAGPPPRRFYRALALE